MPAYGYISCDSNFSNFTGEVGIKTNIALDLNNPFYNQRILIVGKFSISKKDLSNKLRDMGAYVGRILHENIDIVLVGENIKDNSILIKLESLINDGHNIKSMNEEELKNIFGKY